MGVVTLEGKPLRHASVRFIPLTKGLDGNYVAKGLTDDEGRYTLTTAGKGDNGSGACACECKVLVKEGPLPDELVELGQRGFRQIAAYRKSLGNRPIPRRYSTIGKTPLTLTVTPDQTDYPLELSR